MLSIARLTKQMYTNKVCGFFLFVCLFFFVCFCFVFFLLFFLNIPKLGLYVVYGDKVIGVNNFNLLVG